MDNNSNNSNTFNFDSHVSFPKQEHLPLNNPLDQLLRKAEEPPQEDPIQQYLKKITAEKDPFNMVTTERIPAAQTDFQNFYANAGKKYSQIDHLANDVDPFRKEEKVEEPKPEVRVQKEVEIQTLKEEEPLPP